MAKTKLQTIIEIQDRFSNELERFSTELNGAVGHINNLTRSNLSGTKSTDKLAGSFLNLSKIVKGASIAYLGKKIFDLGNFAVDAASKMDELENVTNQVFEKSRKEIEEWAGTIDKQIGRSIYQLENFASIYGAMFKGAGFNESYFKNISKDLSIFTADFSSFFNVTDDEAFTAIKGALTGETEALKRYGIILNDTVMSQYALTKGIKGSWQELDNSLKMQLRYNKLMEITTFIHGDAARTVDGYANSLKKAEGLIDNISTSIGYKLIPGATKIVHMFNDIGESIDSLLKKKNTSDYLFDFFKEKQSIDDLKYKYTELSKLYLKGLGTPESEKERLEIFEKLKVLYPNLLEGINNEAKAYGKVESALDRVIAKLKDKTLYQIQSDSLSKQNTVWTKAIQRTNDFEDKKNNIRLKALSEKRIDPGIISQENIRDLGYYVSDRKYDLAVEKVKKLVAENKLLEGDINSKDNKKLIDTLLRDIKEINDLNIKISKIETQAKIETEKIKIESEKTEKEARQAIEAVEKNNIRPINNKTINNPIIQNKPQVENQDIEAERIKKQVTGIKEDLKNGVYKTAEEYTRVMQELISLGNVDADTINHIQDKIKELKEKAEKDVNINDYKKEIRDMDAYQKTIDGSEEERLKAKASIIQNYLKRAIEQGQDDLIKKFQRDLETTEFSIKKIKVNEALEDVKKSLENLEIKYKKEDISEEEYHKQSFRLLDDIVKSYEENGWKLSKLDKEKINLKIKELKDERDIHGEKIKQYKDLVGNLKKINNQIEALNFTANALQNLSELTGSRTIGKMGNVLGSAANIGNAIKTLKGGADILGSISALRGATGLLGTATAGLSVLGPAAAVVSGVIGIGSMFGKSGKKKAAKIDAQNKENRDKYNEQVKAMQNLTDALMKNTESVKRFSDRMLIDIAKNPTLIGIKKGSENFTLLKDNIISGKHFDDISAIEKGSKKYRSGFRKKRKDTYTAVKIGEAQLLKYLGFDRTEVDGLSDDEMRQLNKALKNINHNDLRRVTGRNLTESNLEEWKKQINEFVTQMDILDKEKSELFKGSTLESFTGIEFKSEKDLIKEYTQQFKELGLVGDKYNDTIKEMAKNNQVFVTSMQDVRAGTIEGLVSGNGGFLTSAKTYFEKIYKNAASIVYDVSFSDIDSYMSDMFGKISEKLLDIKKSGKLDFSTLFSDFDFNKLKIAEVEEIQARKRLDTIKEQLLNNGVDLSIINKVLPMSDFNDRIGEIKNSLASALGTGLQDNSFLSFTKALGQSLYDSLKSSLIKAFSESTLYQGMLQKFIKAEDFKGQLEKAGSFKEAFGLTENILKQFGYELEAAGFGGFNDINNLKKEQNNILGNAYYQDKGSNVEINVTNNFYSEVYGVDDLDERIAKGTETGIKTYLNRPRSDK